jgi:hypothetical protein
LLIMRGEFRAGSDLLRTTLDTYERIGWAVWYPEFLGVLAEGLAGLGRLTEALATVDQALARADRGGERYYVAELLRIKGEVLLQLAGDQSIPAAEGCFHEALEIAQERGALFWELRAALRLAPFEDEAGSAHRWETNSRAGLRSIHRGLRDHRSKTGENAVRAIGVSRHRVCWREGDSRLINRLVRGFSFVERR